MVAAAMSSRVLILERALAGGYAHSTIRICTVTVQIITHPCDSRNDRFGHPATRSIHVQMGGVEMAKMRPRTDRAAVSVITCGSRGRRIAPGSLYTAALHMTMAASGYR